MRASWPQKPTRCAQMNKNLSRRAFDLRMMTTLLFALSASCARRSHSPLSWGSLEFYPDTGSTYTLLGPFPDDVPVPLVGEASPLLEPYSLTFCRLPNSNSHIEVRFKYLSAAPGEYRLAVDLDVYTDSAQPAVQLHLDTEDQRYLNSIQPTASVTVTRVRSDVNIGRFYAGDEIMNDASKVVVSFSTY
jgi:hypothetical protein